MIERLKTVVLMLLVASSLILSTYLWLTPAQETGPAAGFYSPPTLDAPGPPLSALLRPYGIVLYDDKSEWQWTVRSGQASYEQLWLNGDLLRQVLRAAGEREMRPSGESETGRGIKLLFEVELALTDWANAFSVATRAELPNPLFSEFHVSIDDNGYAALLLPTGLDNAQLPLRGLLGSQLSESIERLMEVEPADLPRWEYRSGQAFEGVLLKSGVLVPYHNPPPYYAYAETYDAQNIVEAIFFDQSVPRRIEERDGSVIYTDDRRGLRIYPQTGWEYTSPLGGATEVTDEVTALEVASRFAHTHGGIASDMRITSLRREWNVQGRAWVVGFSQDVEGVAVIGSFAPVTVRVGLHGVEGYRRSLRFAAGPATTSMEVLTPASALLSLSEEFSFSDGRDEGGLAVDVLRLVYWSEDPAREQPILYPVWYAVLGDGRVAVVDGYTGEVRMSF